MLTAAPYPAETKEFRQRVTTALIALHRWQGYSIPWDAIGDAGQLTEAEVESLECLERDDDEPTTIRKLMAALRGEEQR